VATIALFALDCLSMNAMDGGKNAAPWMRVLASIRRPPGRLVMAVWTARSALPGCCIMAPCACRCAAKRIFRAHCKIFIVVCRLIRNLRRTVMAVESVFTALNMRTALRLAEVPRGSCWRLRNTACGAQLLAARNQSFPLRLPATPISGRCS